MKIVRILFLITLLICGKITVQGQEVPENEARPIQKDLRISSGEKFDFIFTRGFLVPGGGIPADSAPLITGTSGSYSLGLGFAIPFKKAVAIRLEPRLTWNNLNFQQTSGKKFPSDSGNVFVKDFPSYPFSPPDSGQVVIFERIRSFYFEMPLGLRFNLARNGEDKVRLFTEVGVSGGVLLSSTFKRRTGTGIDKVTIKAHDVVGMNRLRYGPYFRFGTNWIAVHAFYRLPPVFNENKKYFNPSSQTATPFPLFPKLELGIAIML